LLHYYGTVLKWSQGGQATGGDRPSVVYSSACHRYGIPGRFAVMVMMGVGAGQAFITCSKPTHIQWVFLGLGGYHAQVWGFFYFYHCYHCKHCYCTDYTSKKFLPSPTFSPSPNGSHSVNTQKDTLIPLPKGNRNIPRMIFPTKNSNWLSCGL